MEFDKRSIKKLLTHIVSFESVYNKYAEEKISSVGACFCPFHDNENTPAAKFYPGSNLLWCFAEQRLYTVYDLLEVYGLNPVDVFNRLWGSYSEEKRQGIIAQADNVTTKECLFMEDIVQYSNYLITYDEMCDAVKEKCSNTDVELLYDISREITSRGLGTDYEFIGCKAKLSHWRLLTSGEIVKHVSGLSRYIIKFISTNNSVLLMFNISKAGPIGCSIRSLSSKEFIDVGNTGGVFYNLCNMVEPIIYKPIVLVEGPKDVEMFKFLFKGVNVLGTMTAKPSKLQLEVLKHMTNHLILAFDNDETGKRSTRSFVKYNRDDFNIDIFEHDENMKDFGDLITLCRKDGPAFREIVRDYKRKINMFVGI